MVARPPNPTPAGSTPAALANLHNLLALGGLTCLIKKRTLMGVMSLREELQKRKITYAELGRRVNRHEQTIAKYAVGARPLPFEVAVLISVSTGIPLSAIIDKETVA